VMIVLSLIVLGFAANSNSDQINSLNNQLSDSAYYAAESGINDAYNIISSDLRQNPPATIISQTKNCTKDNNGGDTYIDPGSSSSRGTNYLSSTVSYSCLLVNPDPTTLTYAPVQVGESEVVPLIGKSQTSGGASPIQDLTISWETNNAASPISFSSCPDPSKVGANLPPQTKYDKLCPDAGILQLDIFPDSHRALNNITTNATTTVYLQPNNPLDGTTPAAIVNTVSNASVIPSQCSSAPTSGFYCNATLNLSSLTYANSLGVFYLRVSPFYQESNIEISAKDRVGKPLGLADAQALIDATGDASNVLKRIQESICISVYCQNAVPLNALQSTTGIYKQFTTRPDCTTGRGVPSGGCPP